MTKVDVKEAFDLLDSDADGKLSVTEFGSLVRCLGYLPSETEVTEAANKLGKDKIDFNSVKTFMSNCPFPKSNKSELEEALAMFDSEGQGSIKSQSLSHLLQNLGDKLSPELTESFIQQFGKADNIAIKDIIKKLTVED